jgi:hypothetical protein
MFFALPQRARMRSGVRQHMPPLITVDPPTQRPSAKTMPGVPRIIELPKSRSLAVVFGHVVAAPATSMMFTIPASRSTFGRFGAGARSGDWGRAQMLPAPGSRGAFSKRLQLERRDGFSARSPLRGEVSAKAILSFGCF